MPGCKSVVEHEHNGLLCQLKNPDDLAKKMTDMMNRSDFQIKRFGENGRKKMENEFNESLVIEKYLEAILKLKK